MIETRLIYYVYDSNEYLEKHSRKLEHQFYSSCAASTLFFPLFLPTSPKLRTATRCFRSSFRDNSPRTDWAVLREIAIAIANAILNRGRTRWPSRPEHRTQRINKTACTVACIRHAVRMFEALRDRFVIILWSARGR